MPSLHEVHAGLLLLAIICMACIHSTSAFQRVLFSRTNASIRPGNHICRSTREQESPARIYSEDEMIGSAFYLVENVDEDAFKSKISFAPHGEIHFHSLQDDTITNIRGSWSVDDTKVLRMKIDRTVAGKISEYSFKSFYAGQIKRKNKDFMTVRGDICDEDFGIVDATTTGTFSLVKDDHDHAALFSIQEECERTLQLQVNFE